MACQVRALKENFVKFLDEATAFRLEDLSPRNSGHSLDGREGQVEPVLMCLHKAVGRLKQALTFAGVTECRTMSSRSSPKTDPAVA